VSGCATDGTLTICRGPAMREIRRDDLGERWCFGCRARRPFVFIVSAPVEPSYYGPSGGIECDRGHYDGDLFPGRSREWVEA
jgi:hypothetical protein